MNKQNVVTLNRYYKSYFDKTNKESGNYCQ